MGQNYIWACSVVLVVKNPPAKAGDVRDMGSVPELGRSPGGRRDSPLQYSCLENSMDRRDYIWMIIYKCLCQYICSHI